MSKQTVLITGVSRGLGGALYGLLQATEVCLLGIGRSRPAEAKGLVRAQTRFVEIDLADPRADFSRLDRAEVNWADEVIWISNAGVIEPIDLIGRVEADESTANIRVNFESVVGMANQLVGQWERRAFKLRIVNISSGAAERPLPGWGMYCATKAAARMFFDCLAAEQPEIQVRHLDPGMLDTGMQAEIRAAGQGRFPLHERFQAAHVAGKLKSATAVARDILLAEGLISPG